MSRRFHLQPEAREEISSASVWLEHQRAGSGAKFLATVHELLDHIERNPLLFGVVLDNIRAVSIQKFGYVIYYRVLDHQIEILAVVHGARDVEQLGIRRR